MNTTVDPIEPIGQLKVQSETGGASVGLDGVECLSGHYYWRGSSVTLCLARRATILYHSDYISHL